MNFRNRQRFIRQPLDPKPAVLTLVESSEGAGVDTPRTPLAAPAPPKREPTRLLTPISTARFVSALPSRDACPTCSVQRDEFGRLNVGWCSPDCLMARVRRGEA